MNLKMKVDPRMKFYIGLVLAESIIIAIIATITYQSGSGIKIDRQLPFISFVAIALIIFGLPCYLGGIEEGRRRYGGRPLESLEANKNYKILSLEGGLRQSEECTYSWLQIGENKDDIVGYAKNGCWVRDFKKGDSITQKDGHFFPERIEENS